MTGFYCIFLTKKHIAFLKRTHNPPSLLVIHNYILKNFLSQAIFPKNCKFFYFFKKCPISNITNQNSSLSVKGKLDI